MKTFDPQEGSSALTPSPNQVRFAGPLEGLAFPPICAHCGGGATTRLLVSKVFMRSGSGSNRLRHHVIAGVEVPFCAACAAEHQRELQPLTGAQKLMSVLRSQLAFPAIGSGALGLYFASRMLGDVVRDVSRNWPLAAFVAALLVLSVSCLRGAWTAGLRFRVPAQTRITSSFDFGDDLTNSFSTHGRLYTLRDPGFASAFQALNETTSQTLQGPETKRRKSRNFVIGCIVMGAIALYGFLRS